MRSRKVEREGQKTDQTSCSRFELRIALTGFFARESQLRNVQRLLREAAQLRTGSAFRDERLHHIERDGEESSSLLSARARLLLRALEDRGRDFGNLLLASGAIVRELREEVRVGLELSERRREERLCRVTVPEEFDMVWRRDSHHREA